MATEKELKDLKANWKADPCWDIWTTEGFEDHKDELIVFQQLMVKQWREDYRERIVQKAIKIGCSVQAAEYIETLEKRIDKLEAAK